MATLVALVTILRRGTPGAVRSVNGSGAYDAWRDFVVVSPGGTFTETDTAEVTRLIGIGAARLP